MSFHYLAPPATSKNPNIQDRDILEVLFDGIETSNNYYKFFHALNIPKEKCSRTDFIKGLVERFNLFQNVQGEASRPATATKRSNKNPLPEHVAEYQIKQLRKLEQMAEASMNEPVTFRDFVKFLDALRSSVSMHQASLYGRAGRFASTMNHPGYGGIKRVDKFRKLYGMEMEYDEALVRTRGATYAEDEDEETEDTQNGNGVSTRSKKSLVPKGYGIAPFAYDPEDVGRPVPTQKPADRYKAYNSQPEYLEPREAQRQQDAKYRRYLSTSRSTGHSKDFRVRENRTDLLRKSRIQNHVNSREEKHLTSLFGPRMAETLLQSQRERELLQSRGLERRPASAGSSRRGMPKFAQPLNRSARHLSRPQSGKSTFSSIPGHLLNPQNPNMRLSRE